MASGDRAKFQRLMATLPADLRRRIAEELVKQAGSLVALQKRAVPVEKGALRSSIRAEATPGRSLSVAIRAGGPKTTRPVRKGQKATYDYALGQEFGNRHAPAQPFFFPSYRIRKPAIRRGVGKAVRDTVRKASAR